ncbi:MAG: hypothetical protein ACR2LF_00600 [Jatrophihabitantaceae bacterium]
MLPDQPATTVITLVAEPVANGSGSARPPGTGADWGVGRPAGRLAGSLAGSLVGSLPGGRAADAGEVTGARAVAAVAAVGAVAARPGAEGHGRAASVGSADRLAEVAGSADRLAVGAGSGWLAGWDRHARATAVDAGAALAAVVAAGVTAGADWAIRAIGATSGVGAGAFGTRLIATATSAQPRTAAAAAAEDSTRPKRMWSV